MKFILATKEKRTVSLDFVKDVGEEANMPFAVGGGIRTINNIREIINAGAEKVIINSYAAENPDFIKEASDEFGSSTIIVCMDVKKPFLEKPKTWICNGSKCTGFVPVEFAKLMESKGAGEILVQSIEKDGTMKGYDLDLIEEISKAVKIPVVALGGAGNLYDMKECYQQAHASAMAAGSMFVFFGANKGVLINYPEKNELNVLFK